MRIVHVAAEVAPWSQTGGLAEVAAALPRAQRAAGDDAIVLSPLYRCVRNRAHELGASLAYTGVELDLSVGHAQQHVRIVTLSHDDAQGLYFVDAPELYDRAGLYADEHHHEFHDNALRFAILAKAAVAAAPSLGDAPVDVFHGHDWQAGLVPLFVGHVKTEAATVFTVHNLAYQGVFAKQTMDELGLDWSLFTLEQLELYDRVSFLKGGVSLAGVVTTVSPSYAEEITTPKHGFGLHEFMKHNAKNLTGIVNGINDIAWDPRTDTAIASRFDASDLSGKAACRAALADEFGFTPEPGDLVCGIVSRFAEQKGLDLVLGLVPELAHLRVHLIVLGTGAPDLEARFSELSRQTDTYTHAVIDFDAKLARRIYAGCDAVLMPSRFEPCGLNQLYAMRYGSVPVVHAVGGLRDTVSDYSDEAPSASTGFVFETPDVGGLHWAVARAAAVFRERPADWLAMVRAGMSQDWSWRSSAERYRALYTRARS